MSPPKGRHLVPLPTAADAGMERRWLVDIPGQKLVVYITYRHAGARFLARGQVTMPARTTARYDACLAHGLRDLRDQVERHNDAVRAAQEHP